MKNHQLKDKERKLKLSKDKDKQIEKTLYQIDQDGVNT